MASHASYEAGPALCVVLPHACGSSGGHSSTSQAEKLRADVWALSGPVAPRSPDTQQALRQMLPSDLVANLSHMCGRCLYRTLKKYVQVHGQDGAVFVSTTRRPGNCHSMLCAELLRCRRS